MAAWHVDYRLIPVMFIIIRMQIFSCINSFKRWNKIEIKK